MSYISISTNQPSEGQRELTERQPANLRNDFKVPIEIHNGDTIELVSLKFNIGEIVITADNNKIVWSVGQQPFATYHTALIPIGSYSSPDALTTAIATAFNASTLLPSYQADQSGANPYSFSDIPGWTCTWTPPVGATATTAAKVGFFTIKANQCEGPATVTNKTNGQVARASYTTTSSREIARTFAVNRSVISRDTLPSIARIDIVEQRPIVTTAGGEVAYDEQVWAQKKWDCTGDAAEELAANMYALAIDDTGDAMEEFGLTNDEDLDGFDFFFHSGRNQSGNTGGHSYETSRIANTIVPDSQFVGGADGNETSFFSELGGIYNNGGVIRTEVHPIIGFNIGDFTTSAAAVANFIGQTVTMQIRGYTEGGDPSPIERDFVVAAVAPASNNNWSIKLTTTTAFDATGNGNPEVDTVLWMAYISDLVDPEYGPLKTYANGMFALGFTAGGGASAPPDANDRDNHNAFENPSNGRARNYWYYDADAEHFKCAFRQEIIGTGPQDADGYTRPIRTPFVVNGAIQPAPTMILIRAGSEVPMGILPTQPLGYPACKVGLNRRARITEDFAKFNLNEFAGLASLSDSYIGNPFNEACEYSISINNGSPGPPSPDSVEVDAATGARVPIIKIVNPKPFQRFRGTNNSKLGVKNPPFGDRGWIESNVAEYGRYTDTTKFPALGAFDPTKSLLLEIKLEKNNEITYSIAPITPTTIVSANPFPAAPVLTAEKFDYALPIAVADNDTGVRLMESHFPLCPTIQVGGGGYYGLSGPSGVSGPNEKIIGAAYTIDMAGPYRAMDVGTTQQNPRLAFKDAYPDTAIKQEFSETGGQIVDVVTTIASNSYNSMNQIIERTTVGQQNREEIEFYNNAPVTPSNGIQPTLFRENGEAIRDLRANSSAFGLPGLEISRLNGGGGAVPPTQFISTDKITTSGIETGVSVNILSGNIKGYNGGTSDINKAICFLQPEQLLVNLDGSQRTFFHESKTSRPVEFNVPTTHITQSMTVQLKNGNNELVQGLQAPVEVILYKKSRDNELQKIRAVLEGMKSDKQEYKIQTAGIDNPLLGVIPR